MKKTTNAKIAKTDTQIHCKMTMNDWLNAEAVKRQVSDIPFFPNGYIVHRTLKVNLRFPFVHKITVVKSI